MNDAFMSYKRSISGFVFGAMAHFTLHTLALWMCRFLVSVARGFFVCTELETILHAYNQYTYDSFFFATEVLFFAEGTSKFTAILVKYSSVSQFFRPLFFQHDACSFQRYSLVSHNIPFCSSICQSLFFSRLILVCWQQLDFEIIHFRTYPAHRPVKQATKWIRAFKFRLRKRATRKKI